MGDIFIGMLRSSTLEVEWVWFRVWLKAEEESVCNGTKCTKGVNNEGNKEGIALIECSNNHFTIHKSTDIIDSQATKFLLFSSLKVFGNGSHIG
jgi:hypothetical protein